MALSKLELILNALEGKPVDRVPVAFWHHFLPDAIGANSYLHPELEAVSLLGHRRFIDRFKPDLALIMTDGFFAYPGPYLKEPTPENLKALKPLPSDHEFFERQLHFARTLNELYGGEIPLFYNLFSFAGTFSFTQPNHATAGRRLTDLITGSRDAVLHAEAVVSCDIARLASRLITEAGITGIFFSIQNNALSGVNAELSRTVLAPGEKRILDTARKAGGRIILHLSSHDGQRNNLTWYQDYDFDALNYAASVEKVTLGSARKLFKGRTVIGGFDSSCTGVLHLGNEDAIKATVRALLREAGRTGIILGADGALPRNINLQHLQWVREAVQP